jgi:hypothetical protein
MVIFWLSLSVLSQRIHHLHSHTHNKMYVNAHGTWIHYLYASMRLQLVQKVQIIHKSGLPHEKTRHFLTMNILCSRKVKVHAPQSTFPLKFVKIVFVMQPNLLSFKNVSYVSIFALITRIFVFFLDALSPISFEIYVSAPSLRTKSVFCGPIYLVSLKNVFLSLGPFYVCLQRLRKYCM